MYDIRNYQQADSVAHAIELLAGDPGARLLAGGTDVLVKLHKGQPGWHNLVDIHSLEELKQIRLSENGDLKIGAGASFSQVLNSAQVQAYTPVLGEAVGTIGGPQIRNVATMGGNICNGVPSADSAPALLALNAQLTLQGPEGVRRLPITDFFISPGKVALQPAEMLTSFTITRPNIHNLGGYYYKYAMREAMDIATIGCAAVAGVDGQRITDLRLAFGVAGPVPLRCRRTEALVIGNILNDDLLAEVSETVVTDLNPRTSWRAPKDFRIQIIRTLATRVILKAVANCQIMKGT